jgi:hypothetical protein
VETTTRNFVQAVKYAEKVFTKLTKIGKIISNSKNHAETEGLIFKMARA